MQPVSRLRALDFDTVRCNGARVMSTYHSCRLCSAGLPRVESGANGHVYSIQRDLCHESEMRDDNRDQ